MAEKRSIFEEVSETQKPAATPGGVTGGRGTRPARDADLVAGAFRAGGDHDRRGRADAADRQGLSITEWAPLSGAIPPLSAEDWEAEFAAYRAIPEYQLQNRGMSWPSSRSSTGGNGATGSWAGSSGWSGRSASSGFWWLAPCRAAGRGARCSWGGLAGCRVRSAGGWCPPGLAPGMLDVASYRLAMHLGLAFLILALIAWFVLQLGREEAELMPRGGRATAGSRAWRRACCT
jgi:cytochrome c oxidase assembly protein subunit 15